LIALSFDQEIEATNNKYKKIMENDTIIKKIVVLDLETTGLPKMKGFNDYHPYSDTKMYDSARIVQMSFGVYDTDGQELDFHDLIIKPNNFIIPQSSIKFHKITNEIANATGIDLQDALCILDKTLNKNVIKIVGHNIRFDINVLLSELHRKENNNMIHKISQIKKICTMFGTKNIVQIINYTGTSYKLPKMRELYYFLFKKVPIMQHNAKYDVIHTAQCYFELLKKW